LLGNEVGYSSTPCELFANWNQESLSWKTSQRCLLEGWTTFSGRWPRSGLMRSGTVYRLRPLVPRISGTGFSSSDTEPEWWGTPNAHPRTHTPRNEEDAAEVADSDKSKREALRRDGLGKGKPTQPPSRIGRGRNQWAIEPDVGGSVDGFPNFLDRHIGRGLSHGESQRAVEGLRNVWNEHISKAVQRSLGGLGRIQAAEVLFALMREYARGGGIPREFVAGTEALAETLRDLRGLEIARGTPRGREQEQQHAGEYPDSMRDMSQQIASWNAFESGIDRTATSIPARVDRLRGLGNAVVPQVAEWIGRRVMELLA